MEITKDEAREYLEDWIEHKMKYSPKMILPILDEVVINSVKKPIPQADVSTGIWPEGEIAITQYTFRHLIKIAYNLKDND